MTKRTKIVATLGPASQSRGQVEALAREGVDVFRLNAAHGDKAWHDGATARVREVSDALGRPLAVLQDLAGPKLRLGELPGGAVSCQRGDRFRLRAAAAGGPGELPINEPSLIGDLRVGNDVLLADGTVALRIVATHRDHAEAEVTLPGEARSRQGISAPHTALRLPSLTPKDLRDLDDALARGVDYVGLSFVRTPADVELLRTEMTKRGGNAAIIAKIETARALDALDDIICAADGVMVARGDLGVELDVARVPMLQKRIINRSRSFGVPVITATQMLESMRTSGRPTRAEASDVANAILDGTDAVMLSAETASGNYPLEAARTMRRIIEETEHVQLGGTLTPGPSPGGRGENTSGLSSVLCSLSSVPEGITLAAVEAAGRLADRIEARLIVVATRGAHTALACARHRFRTPTLGLSDRPATLRRLALLWGVLPVRFDDPGSIPALIEKAAAYVVRAKLADRGDRLVYVLGQQWVDGAHNSILIHEIR